jgi:hypothetical protein
MSCVPYANRKRYYAQTAILFVVTGSVFVYMWTVNPIISLLMLVGYFLTNYGQAYCCAYQECPYVGQFCPALFGIFPANLIARRMVKKGVTRSKKRFEVSAAVAFGSFLIGVVLLPLYWLYLLNIWYAVLYFAFHLVSVLIFFFTICPTCSIRDTCPGGKVHQIGKRA